MTISAARIAPVVCAVAAAVLGAAQHPQQPPPRFRTGIDVIQVDVTVLDRNRRPVRALTAADFTVLEDGKPQSIVGFTEIVIPEPEVPPARWMRDVAPDVRTNDVPAEGRLVVIVLDDATLPPVAGMATSAKDIARKIVDSMGPQDLAAVVFTLNNRHSQDFTADRARLLGAIDRFAPAFGYTQVPANIDSFTQRGNPTAFADDGLYRQYSIGTVTRAAEYLRSIPQRRKTLFYVSVGIPIDIEEAFTPLNLGAEGVRANASVTQQTLIRELQDTFAQAVTANVNIYAVDPAGLGGMENFLTSRRVELPEARRQAGLQIDYLRTVAENSGGRAIVDTNDLERAIGEVFAENSSYYLLGYQTANAAQDGRYRRLDVRVNRPGVTVQSRKGYFTPRPPKPRKADEPEPSPLVTAMAGFLPKGDVPMQVVAVPFAIPGRKEAAVAVVARLQHPPVAKRTVQQVELIASAFDPQGKPKASRRQTARVVILPTDDARVEYEALARIDLKPGQYNLRIAAHNSALDKSGSVYYDVDVPDFSKDGVSVSGVLLSATPGLPAAPRDLFTGWLPVIPTTVREFAREDAAIAVLQIYQRGKTAAAAVAARVLDQKGATVDQIAEAIGPERFSTNATADFRYHLPLAVLAPGPHLLTIEIKAGDKTITRDVRFVRK